MDYQVFTLPNGIRLLFKPFPSTIAHACILINTGSRDEDFDRPGLAHFIEHLLFKRTERRTTNQILNRLELVGADLNAYTTKEYTCIHASFLNPHLERALDLFEDLVFHSVFPDEEMEKEKGVILDEIASYEDQPEDAVNDKFEELVFSSHPMGNNILGTAESVKAFKRTDVLDFIRNNYNTHEIIIGVHGSYDLDKLKRLMQKLFGDVPENNVARNRQQITAYQPIKKEERKPISQSHCVMGNRAYNIHNKNKVGLLLLNNLLGGTGMSSRLNLELREKHGIAYTIESNYTPFGDTGIFSIYFGTDPEKTEKAFKIINRELKKLMENPLGTVHLHQSKQRFIGQIALGEENRMGLIISMAKSLLDYDRIDTLEEIFGKVNAVTAVQLHEISNEIFSAANLSMLLFSPG